MRSLRKGDVVIIGVLLLLALLMVVSALLVWGHQTAPYGQAIGTGTVQATPTIDPTVVAALTAKENLRKLERDNDRSFNAWFWNSSTTFGTIAAALLAVAGVLWTAKVAQDKNLADSKAERTRRDEEQKRWLKDQETEREKRAEERFQSVVEGLGSERTEAKVGAAITLRTFLQPGYERFSRQAFDLAVAHLRLRKAEASAPGSLSSPTEVPIVLKGSLLQRVVVSSLSF